ncbi:MAG TPA: chorismate-binding protein, partial [Smithellaceae bacterium]|nr:chorismate-binding protein [Smithellaceae bacterium]
GYRQAISTIKDLIARGETYQINYTTKYLFDFDGNVFDFYATLKSRQKVSYAALISFGGNFAVSLSPELFFRIDRWRKITVKPMKGTATIDTPPGWLSRDSKNTSENVMIVDLLRNDLGRICKPGSVKVQELFTVEEYETLLQMTSTVTGKLKDDIGLCDIIRSLFPCGSVTGAPKIQSMKIIRDLEKGPRDIYTGAIGYFAPDGKAVFNVAIRTVDLQRKTGGGFMAAMGVGGGIVFDSQPDAEYEECRLKAKFLIDARPDPALIETMLWKNGRIRHLTSHLARMKASAAYFSIPFAAGKIRAALKEYSLNLGESARLRMLLKSTGDIFLEHALVPPESKNPVIAISDIQTNSGDPFLYHKSTHRRLYDDEYRKYAARGYFDVLFTNEKKQITEGAISNIFIERTGRWYTPELACGLLPGIERQKMIRKLAARETVLHEKDLRKADKIVLTNAVRGATEVDLKG